MSVQSVTVDGVTYRRGASGSEVTRKMFELIDLPDYPTCKSWNMRFSSDDPICETCWVRGARLMSIRQANAKGHAHKRWDD